MSVRADDILTAIQLRFKTISVSTGYHTTFGQNVFICRPGKIELQDHPALNIWDAPETAKIGDMTDGPASIDRWRMPVQVDILFAGTSSQVRAAIADIYKSIGTDHTWGELAEATYLFKHSLTVDQAENKISGATVMFYVDYRNARFQES